MLDINDDTQIKTTIKNDNTKVEYSVENTIDTVGKDNREQKNHFKHFL